MAIEGTLGDFRLEEILQSVAQQRRTGILTLQSETTIVAVSFLAGNVVSADSLAHTVEERLGEGLVAEGLVEPATIADLARRQEAGEARLIDLLVSEGVLSREGVLDALRRQNLALLRELLGWSEGEFKFYGGDEVSYEEGVEPISVEGLLLSTLGEEGGGVGGGAEPVPSAATPLDAGPSGSLSATAELTEAGEVSEEARAAGAASAGPAVAGGGGWAGEAPAAGVAPAAGPASAARVAAATALPSARRARPAPPPRTDEEAAAAPALGPAPRAVPAALGLLLAAVVAAAVFAAPQRLLLPFSWQSGERQALAEVQRLADRLAIDRAAKTFFLLEGHFPPSLDPLVAAGLLGAGDRVGPEGRRLSLVAHEDSYDVLAEGGEQPVWSEAITGNFLLDPDLRLTAAPSAGADRPLVLLD
jgi:hypothetical protein